MTITGRPTARTVTSADGTRIGYLQQGSGPGIVLVQGAMADVHAYRSLAKELEATHTVHRVERRGRGLSPLPYDVTHDIARDVEDVAAVLDATGASTVFGLSSGAVITLEAARTLTGLERVAVYEPPLYRDGLPDAQLRDLFAEIEGGDDAAALVEALLLAGTAPGPVRRLPRPVVTALARVVLVVDAAVAGRRSSLRDLVPGVRYDFHDVAQLNRRVDTLSTIDVPVLLLRGTTSPPFLHDATTRLHTLLPRATVVELAGLGHDGPWSSGGPADVARAVRSFIAENPRNPGI